MVAQPQSLAAKLPGPDFLSRPLGVAVVADRRRRARRAVREEAQARRRARHRERDSPTRYGVSRIVARDALRTLEALGIAEIRMGKGGGARVARGNPRLFAEALAVQLDLTGVERCRDHGRAARDRVPRRRACRRERDRRRHRAAAAASSPTRKPAIDDVERVHAARRRVPSRGRRGLAQPRAGGAAHLAAARVVAAAQSDADAEGRRAASSTCTRSCWR